MRRNYFHAVLEAPKSAADKLRALTNNARGSLVEFVLQRLRQRRAGEPLARNAANPPRLPRHRPNQVEVLLARSELARFQSLHTEALAHADCARHLAGKGYALALGKAHSAISVACLGLGDLASCEEQCEQAPQVSRRTEQRPAPGQNADHLGQVLRATGRQGAVRSAWQRARHRQEGRRAGTDGGVRVAARPVLIRPGQERTPDCPGSFPFGHVPGRYVPVTSSGAISLITTSSATLTTRESRMKTWV